MRGRGIYIYIYSFPPSAQTSIILSCSAKLSVVIVSSVSGGTAGSRVCRVEVGVEGTMVEVVVVVVREKEKLVVVVVVVIALVKLVVVVEGTMVVRLGTHRQTTLVVGNDS